MTAMNNAPVLTVLLPNQSSAEDEAVSFALPANAFTDPDGDALTLSATLVGGAALPGWLAFDAVSGSFSGTPPQDFHGTLSVQVTASDGSLLASSSFTLDITPVNDAPVAVDDVAQSSTPITEDVVTLIDTATLLGNDSDIEGDALTVTGVSATSTYGAALTLNTDGTISYDPTGADAVQALAEGQTLTDTFTYTIADGNGGESTASVSILVHGKDEALMIVGTTGGDILYGCAGNDYLRGDAGNDILYGLDGDDILYGDDGNDILYGGAGNDEFVFGNNFSGNSFGNDTIKDFEDGIDLISFYNIAGMSYSDLTIIRIGSDTAVSVSGHGTITLCNFSVTNLTEADFLF
ncbi:Ig-like domain-containing protein [Cognatiyoonia sp. IB215182]|uniref:Ig-like domain-containing protein n=1 Tax=Cognatiyoonia sp. IB215182 TaxID=3097353 RepID=UPI002A0B7B6B|nr:tandem-95 repeat protein [Cognatiyoonia sp. IB215182]MDX8355777.1 tandem-95 repeat protein [Cognatiyoonia sp. IB215182]